MTHAIRLHRKFAALAHTVALGAVAGISSTGAAQSGSDQAAAVPRPAGAVQLHGTVSYVPPAGWAVQRMANGITLLTGPVKPEDRPCEIRMLAPTRAQGDLATQGASLVQAVADASRAGSYLDNTGRDVRLSREEGVSGTGWSYTDLSGQLGRTGITARVLMVSMGNQVLPILGFSKTWNCLGNQAMRDNDVWALLFHSLQVPGFSQDSPQLAKQLVGMWSSASGNAGTSETFAPNGRFATVAVYQSYALSSTPGMVWEVDRSWQGDGPYTVQGDKLHTQNPHGSETERDATRYFSIVRMPNDNKPGGFDLVLRMVERSWDGSPTWGFSPNGNFVTHMIKSNPDHQ